MKLFISHLWKYLGHLSLMHWIITSLPSLITGAYAILLSNLATKTNAIIFLVGFVVSICILIYQLIKIDIRNNQSTQPTREEYAVKAQNSVFNIDEFVIDGYKNGIQSNSSEFNSRKLHIKNE